jgi:ABC-type sugar transport system substrate-binding protein
MGEAYHMTLLRIWRTTVTKEAREFAQALGRNLEWGVSDFRADVLKEFTAIETVLRGGRIE